MFLDGILLLDKDTNMSSTNLDYKIKKLFHTSKVGHLGTLDPFASGLMIIGVNEGTKILPYIDSKTKTYRAKLKLFELTETLDNTSEIVRKDIKIKITEEKVKQVLKEMETTYNQIPPKYSSKSVNGVRAYMLARENIPFSLKAKEVTIYKLDLISFKDDIIEFDCKVSNGTYIRSLGLDIANKLNTVGHLVYLRRTSIGNYSLDSNCKKHEDLTQDDLIYIKDIDTCFSKYYLNDEEFNKVKYGNPFNLNTIKDKYVMYFYENNILFLTMLDEKTNKYKILRGCNYEYYRNR